jgi:hypothetical protein
MMMLNAQKRRWYRKGPMITAVGVGGYNPPKELLHVIDASERTEERDDGGNQERQRKKFSERRAANAWDAECKLRLDQFGKKRSEKRGGREFVPERRKSDYRRAMKKQMFVMMNNGEKRRNEDRNELAKRERELEKWKRLSALAREAKERA